MDQITATITLVVAVSVAVERVTEIIKQMFPVLANELTDEKTEGWRRAALQTLAAGIGTLIAWFGNLQLGSHGGWSAFVVIGLMSSGGSAFWNHSLDALRAMKIDKEAAASEKAAISKQMIAKMAATT